MKIREAVIVLILALFFVATPTVQAVNFGDGYKLEGAFLALYPYWYTANRYNNDHGDAVTKKLRYDAYVTLIRPLYYKGNFTFNATIPVAKVKNGFLDGSDSGIGDIRLGMGYFLPIKEISILPMIQVKFRTGNFSVHDSVNLGDGQTDIRLETYFNKFLFDYKIGIDGALRYFVRCKENGVDPGNEFYVEALTTYQILKSMWIGPSAIYMIGDKDKEKVSLGGELIYRYNPKFLVLLNIMNDVKTRNQMQGTLYMMKFTIGF